MRANRNSMLKSRKKGRFPVQRKDSGQDSDVAVPYRGASTVRCGLYAGRTGQMPPNRRPQHSLLQTGYLMTKFTHYADTCAKG